MGHVYIPNNTGVKNLSAWKREVWHSTVLQFSRIKATPDNLNLQDILKKVWVIRRSSYPEFKTKMSKNKKKRFLLYFDLYSVQERQNAK